LIKENAKLVRALWNDEFLRVLEKFPAAKHDHEVDALSGAHQTLCEPSGAIRGAATS
jgi:phage terminase large subunit-like protein